MWFFCGKWMVKRGEKTVRSRGGTPVPVGDFRFLPQKSQMVADVVFFEGFCVKFWHLPERRGANSMNLPGWILERLAQRPSRKSDAPMRISNLTRQAELAHRVDVADDGTKRRKGLLGREALSAGEGLWIVPCESIHTFGMQFPIDLIYLDRDKRVKKVRNDVPPWRISACLSAHSVLELAPGSIRRTGTKPGDRLEFSSALLPNDCRINTDACDPAWPGPANERG